MIPNRFDEATRDDGLRFDANWRRPDPAGPDDFDAPDGEGAAEWALSSAAEDDDKPPPAPPRLSSGPGVFFGRRRG